MKASERLRNTLTMSECWLAIHIAMATQAKEMRDDLHQMAKFKQSPSKVRVKHIKAMRECAGHSRTFLEFYYESKKRHHH